MVFVRITPNFLYLYNLIFVPILNVLIDKCQDKIIKLKKLATKYDIEMLQIAYMGDDLNDLECMKSVGLSGCPTYVQKEILPIALSYLKKKVEKV